MKKNLSLLLAIIMLMMLVGCSSTPKGDPSQVLNDYYDKLESGNVEGAYDLLTEASKKNYTKEDFIKYQSLVKEAKPLKGAKGEKINEAKDPDLNGNKYKYVSIFNVTETYFDIYNNNENSYTYKRYVVDENGVWKIFLGGEGKEFIAIALYDLSYLYKDGKGGKSRDLNQAAIILNDGIKSSQKQPILYYALAIVYEDLGRYDEAINSVNTYISKDTDNKEKSDGYNVLGNIYKAKDDTNDAKASYNKAIELNPDNEYAKTNLAKLN